MIEKAAQTEIVLRFEDGWIDMHKRDGDECVHAAAAQHNTPCEQEAVPESVNEEGGRSLKIEGLKTSVHFEPPKLDEDDSSPRRARAHKNLKKTNNKHLNTTPHILFIASWQ